MIIIGQDVEVVNNLTEGGSDKALSAEMGKQLAETTLDVPVADEVDLTEFKNDENISLLQFKDRAYDPEQFSGKGSVILRKNIIEGKNYLTQAMLTQTNTIYHIRYDFHVAGPITIPEGCVLNFDGGSIIYSGAITLNNTKLSGDIQLDTILQGTINNEALNSRDFTNKTKFIDSINKVQGCTSIVFEPIEYVINESLKINDSCTKLVGNSAVIIDNILNENALTIATNSIDSRVLTQLTSDVIKGQMYIEVADASAFSVGDDIMLRNFTEDSYKSGFKEGEICEVYKIEGNTILLSKPIYGNYLANSDVYLRIFRKLDIFDIEIRSEIDTEKVAMKVINLKNSQIKNVKFINYRMGLWLVFSYKCNVDKITSVNAVRTDTTSYGISIINCQSVTLTDCDLIAGNHGLQCGGGYGDLINDIINRDIIYNNIKATSSGSIHLAGLDFHGNCEYYIVDKCLSDGLNIGGGMAKITNSIFRGSKPTSSVIVDGRKNLEVFISDCYFEDVIFSTIIRESMDGIVNIHNCSFIYDRLVNNIISLSRLIPGVSTINMSNNIIRCKDFDLRRIMNIYYFDIVFSNNTFENIELVFNNDFKNLIFNSNKFNTVLTRFINFSSSFIKYENNIFLNIQPRSTLAYIIISGNSDLLVFKNNTIINNGSKVALIYSVATTINCIDFSGNYIGSQIYVTNGTGIKKLYLSNNINLDGTPLDLSSSDLGENTVSIVLNNKGVSEEISSDKFKGLSSMLLDNPSTIDVSKISEGYESFHDGKPIWWDGTQWVDGVGNPVQFN